MLIAISETVEKCVRRELSKKDKAMLQNWEDTEVFWSNSNQTADRTSILEGFKRDGAFKYHAGSIKVKNWYQYVIEKINDHEDGADNI